MPSGLKDRLADLIAGAAGGDREAFRDLYEATSAKLYAVILRIIRDRPTADDVLQDVYLRIWRNAATYTPEAGSPMTWLNSIARNRAIDLVRRKTYAPPPAEDGDVDYFERLAAPGDVEQQFANRAELRRCLGEIAEPNRSCVLLAYYQGYSREELAARFDQPPNTIKTWLHRSLVALRSCLDSRR